MYRLNVITEFDIYKSFLSLKYISSHLCLSSAFNHFENWANIWLTDQKIVFIGFDILDICFFLTESTDSSWSDHPPALLVSPDCVLWLCDWLWTRRLGYCHHDHDQSPGFPLACAAWPVILIPPPQTRSSPSTGAILRSRRVWLWVSLMVSSLGLNIYTS